MKVKLLLLTILLVSNLQAINTIDNNLETISGKQNDIDSMRIAALDKFWAELSRTVREGDFEGYKATYHDDAVIIFASGKNKTSVSISDALAGWKQGFLDTKAGKMKANVEFRFSQRLGNANTAHETGIFEYSTADSNGNITGRYITHFEMLFVKKDDTWLALMEYQKSNATQEEWEALK